MKYCSSCKKNLPKESFSKKQWLQSSAKKSRCIKCVEEEKAATVEKNKKKDILDDESLTLDMSNVSFQDLKPPRATEKILGKIGPNSKPTAKVMKELLDALIYERQSPSYLHAVKQLHDGSSKTVPRTYEVDGMMDLNHFLFSTGTKAPFRFMKIDLPAQDVLVLQDKHMGDKDYKSRWDGGVGLVLNFESRYGQLAPPFTIYMGECYFTPQDLWHYAVHFRKGQSNKVWPDHRSLLLCPFCAHLLIPDNRKTKHVMIARFILQRFDAGMAVQFRPQLCCRKCFQENHNVVKDEPWEEFPNGCKQHSVSMLCSLDGIKLTLVDCPDAYNLCTWFENSGMQAACSKEFMNGIRNGIGHATDTDWKVRKSKSMTKANRGQDALKIKVRKKETCSACGIQTIQASACSACKNTHYCSRECQRRHWKMHKKTCNTNSSIEPIPSADIVVNNKPRFSEKEMQDKKNCCKACFEFEGDTHGKEAYCFGCASYLFCGSCNGAPKGNNGICNNGGSAALCKICEHCYPKVNQKLLSNAPGVYIRSILNKHPVGMHVNHFRLCLVQLMMHDTKEETGIEHDVETAKNELYWLANNLDYAPAQLALASLHDPLCHEDGQFYDGPLNPEFVLQKPRKSPFPVNKQIAKKYYERALEQHLACALYEVGLFYEEGCNPKLYPRNVSKGVSMLENAAKKGHTLAMARLGGYYNCITGEEDKAIEVTLEAANNGHFASMFLICQKGIYHPELKEFGEKFIEICIEEEFRPTPARNSEWLFKKVASYYGHEV